MFRSMRAEIEFCERAIAESLDEGAVTVQGYRDIKGKHPGDKDYQRMLDIKIKANGSEAKAMSLAQAMARAVGRGGGDASREKAHRRAKAALEVFPGDLGRRIADFFMDAADVKFLSRSTSRMEDLTPGGFGDDLPDDDFDPLQLALGIDDEHEHSDDDEVAKEIAKDHLVTNPYYYTDQGDLA